MSSKTRKPFGLRLATEAEVIEQLDQMLAEGYEFDDEGHIVGWPVDPWQDQQLLDDDEKE